jgi:hypothetical protein
MDIVIDTATVPPTAALLDPADLKSLKVTVRVGKHVYVPIAELLRLAGPHADDPEWRRAFDAMIAYAGEHGWVRDGAVRAHVETQDA